MFKKTLVKMKPNRLKKDLCGLSPLKVSTVVSVTMSRFSTLDTLSDRLFFSAIVINRAGKMTIPVIAHICFIISSVLYLSGYIFWQTAVYEDESRRHQFAHEQKCKFDREFRHNQYYRYTAFFGVIACVLALFSLSNPVTAVISAWLFLVSNACWFNAERITLNRLQTDEPDSPACKAQSIYFKYTTLSTTISLLTPILFTLAVLVPPVGVPLTSIATFYLIGLNLLAISNWIRSGRAFSRIPDKSPAIRRLEEEAGITEPPKSSHLKIIQKIPPGSPEQVKTCTDRKTPSIDQDEEVIDAQSPRQTTHLVQASV